MEELDDRGVILTQQWSRDSWYIYKGGCRNEEGTNTQVVQVRTYRQNEGTMWTEWKG